MDIVLRLILFINNVATKQDNISAIIKVVHTVQIIPADSLARRENPHATGSTKIKLKDIILIALIHISCVSPDNPKSFYPFHD